MRINIENWAVVIVTYLRYSELEKTILAILNEGIFCQNIFVIDNNQRENRNENFYLDFPGINPVFTDSNISSSGGFSLGMKTAHEKGFEYVLLYNDDSRPLKGAIQSFVESLLILSDRKVGMLKIGNLNSKGQVVVINWEGVRKPIYIPIGKDPVRSDLITFDGCLISTDLMSEIGYCDPQYFMGTYEFDYCLRASDIGFEIYTIPNGLIEDGKLGSVGGIPPWRQYYNTRNHLWLGLNRKSIQTILAWTVRELKFTYAILRWEDQKGFRIGLKLLATLHALIGKRGKVLNPLDFQKSS